MKVFLDTSSLLKLYHHEVGTERLLNTLSQGRELLMKYEITGLRTLDAIQLASALTLKEQPKIYFFTADQLLQSFFGR
jgi:hypothetical protein